MLRPLINLRILTSLYSRSNSANKNAPTAQNRGRTAQIRLAE